MAMAMTRSTSGHEIVSGRDIKTFEDLAAKLLMSGLLSERVKTLPQAVLLMAKARELGIGPIEGLSKLYIVRGVVAAESQLMMGLAMKSGVVRVVWHEQSPDGCSATFYRYSPAGVMLQEYTSTWTWERVQQAGFHKDRSGNMKQTYGNPASRQVMIKHKVEAEGLRTVAPDIIGGVYSPEEFGVQSLSELTPEVIDSVCGENLPIGVGGADALRALGMDCLQAGAPKDAVTAIYTAQKASAGVSHMDELTHDEAEVVRRALGQLLDKHTGQPETPTAQPVLDGEVGPAEGTIGRLPLADAITDAGGE